MIDLWYKNAILYCLDVGTFADGNDDGSATSAGFAITCHIWPESA